MTEIEFLHEMVKKAGGNPDMLKDKLKSTYYECLIDCMKNGGGGSGGGGGSSGEYTQPDWGYKEAYILPETEVTLVMDEVEGMVVGPIYVSNFAILPEPGKEYIVTYNGKEYKCILSGMGILGNQAIIGGEDTGEPFAIFFIGDPVLVIPTDQSEGTAKVSIKGTIVKQIDPEYAPQAEIPYIDLISVGLGPVGNSKQVEAEYSPDFYFENIQPMLGKPYLKVKIGLSCKAYGALGLSSNAKGVNTYNEEMELVLHAGRSESGRYEYATILSLGILYVHITNNLVLASYQAFNSTSFVLNNSFPTT